jgi:hypothetical protein
LANGIDSQFSDYALVDNGRVDVPVRDHNFTTLKSRLNPGVRMIEAVSSKQSSFLQWCLVSDFDSLECEFSKITMSAWLMGSVNLIERIIGEEFC